MADEFSNEQEILLKYFVGNKDRYRENIVIPRVFGPAHIKTKEEKLIEATMESCPFKSSVSLVLGKLNDIELLCRYPTRNQTHGLSHFFE